MTTRLGPTSRLVLQILARRPEGLAQLDLAKQLPSPRNVSIPTGLLSDRNAIWRNAEGLWFITPLGRQLLAANGSQTAHSVRYAAKPARPERPAQPKEVYVGKVAGPRNHVTTGHYTGADLRPQQTRPSGNDALALPSLINGVRVSHHSQIIKPE